MKVYYRNSNKNIFIVDIKPDETMKEAAAKIQDKGGLIPCHVSVTMVNNVCDCGKRIAHLLLESLDNPIDIGTDSELEIDNAMEDSFTYVNRLHEETKLKQVKNEVLGDLRNELKTIIENQFKESCQETSQHNQNNDDVMKLLKEEIEEYLKGELKEKNEVISNLIGFCKSSSGSLQDNSSPWLPVDTRRENRDFTLDTTI